MSSGCSTSSFYQSVLVGTISGADIADYFPKRKAVGYLRNTCFEAIKESSSHVKPHRTLLDEVVHGLLLHGAVRTYLRNALRFVLIEVVLWLALARKLLCGCP